MTAPAEEAVELRQSEGFAHYYCSRCWGPGAVQGAVSLCGKAGDKRGGRGWVTNDCPLCAAAWQMRPLFTCGRCGRVPQ